MSDIEKIEYRVIPVIRYHVTRYEQNANSAGTDQRGQYDNADVAYEVACALCKAEHDRLGLPLGDERIQYPQHPKFLNKPSLAARVPA